MIFLLLCFINLAKTTSPPVVQDQIKIVTFERIQVVQNGIPVPVHELQCHGEFCKTDQADVAWCIKERGPNAEIQWNCNSHISSHLKLGKYVFACDGKDVSSIATVLTPGSCILEYHLVPNITYAETFFGLLISAIFFFILFGCVHGWVGQTKHRSIPDEE